MDGAANPNEAEEPKDGSNDPEAGEKDPEAKKEDIFTHDFSKSRTSLLTDMVLPGMMQSTKSMKTKLTMAVRRVEGLNRKLKREDMQFTGMGFVGRVLARATVRGRKTESEVEIPLYVTSAVYSGGRGAAY